MPICDKCESPFPNRIKIDDKIRVLSSRKYCLECSPFKSGNTRDLTKGDNINQRLCPCCDTIKSCDHFYKRGRGGLSSYCKTCSKAESRNRHRRFKEKCIEYSGGECQHCGYKRFYGALEFHHLDPSQKDFGISCAKGHKFNDKIKQELDKCILLCSNCHKEEHDRLSNQ